MPPRDFSAADIEAEDWSAHERGGKKAQVICLRDHAFTAFAKFSGRLGSLVSRDPCPVCGTHDLRSVRHEPEHQNLRNKDIGNADEVA